MHDNKSTKVLIGMQFHKASLIELYFWFCFISAVLSPHPEGSQSAHRARGAVLPETDCVWTKVPARTGNPSQRS